MGGYTLERRVRPGSPKTTPPGRLYTARHSAKGRPALVVAVDPSEDPPEAGWRVQLETGAHPKPHLAVQVLRSPAECANPMQSLAEVVDLAAAALESVEALPEVHSHLSGRPSVWRQLWRTHARTPRPGYLGALGGAVVAGVLALLSLRSAHGPATAQAPEGGAVAVGEAALEAPELLSMPVLTVDNRARSLALDMPRKPFENQYRPDKDGKCKGEDEVPIYGGCWVALKREPPCGQQSYEYKDTCYLPSAPAAKAPSSRAPHTPAPPAQRAE
jgi:hypothetical protein